MLVNTILRPVEILVRCISTVTDTEQDRFAPHLMDALDMGHGRTH